MLKIFAVFILAWPAWLWASCESSRLTAGAPQLALVLDRAVQQGLWTHEQMQAFANETEWRNPFSHLGFHLLKSQYVELFDRLDASLDAIKRAEVKAALKNLLTARVELRAVEAEARRVTRSVFTLENLATFVPMPKGYQGGDSVFEMRQENGRLTLVRDVIRLKDNAEFILSLDMSNPLSGLSPRILNREDVQPRETHTPAEWSKIVHLSSVRHAAVFNLGGREIIAAAQGSTLYFRDRQGQDLFPPHEIPGSVGEPHDSLAMILTEDHGEIFAFVPYSFPRGLALAGYYILNVTKGTGIKEVRSPLAKEHVGVFDGQVWLYGRGRHCDEAIFFINARTGRERTVTPEDLDEGLAHFQFRGQSYAVWTETIFENRRRLAIYNFRNQEVQRFPVDLPNISEKLQTFEYQDEIYLVLDSNYNQFVPDVIKLTGPP